MSIPYRIRPEISSDGDIRRDQSGHREDTAPAMPAEGNRNNRSGTMQRPHTYAREYSTEVQRIPNYGISQGQEQPNDIRPTRKSKVQVWQPTLLGQRVFRRYGRKEQEANTRVYSLPT